MSKRPRIVSWFSCGTASALNRDALASASGYSPSSSGFSNYLGELRSLGLIDYPSRGMVRAEDILFI